MVASAFFDLTYELFSAIQSVSFWLVKLLLICRILYTKDLDGLKYNSPLPIQQCGRRSYLYGPAQCYDRSIANIQRKAAGTSSIRFGDISSKKYDK
ncbi:hypothetical protein CEXT_799241 [Caerostris extrusa]|uniref:Uncharacterized protein n=1 Tax=Caerostris extrusa TaxID=172846 RepID=A0AAV4NAN8_CAEEX|nr:hypothetical protein CEXT_799241 [Caerostris extrusa]